MIETESILEYNILGSKVRVKANDEEKASAQKAIALVESEISQLKESSSHLSELDIAILAALKLASKSCDLEAEFRENVLALKDGIQDALGVIEEVSPGKLSN